MSAVCCGLQADYLLSMTTHEECLVFKANSNSGGTFFFTADRETLVQLSPTQSRDRMDALCRLPEDSDRVWLSVWPCAGRYMVKTHSKSESKFLRRILKDYLEVRYMSDAQSHLKLSSEGQPCLTWS